MRDDDRPLDDRRPVGVRSERSRRRRIRRLLSPRDAGDRRPAPLEAFFGALELDVLEFLWKRSEEATVRDVQRDFPETAYTTLMTTLDRLFKKEVLDRCKDGRAYAYWPRFGRSELRSRLARDAFEALLGSGQGQGALRPLMSTFVEAVSERDAALLDELEEMVDEERRARRRSGGDGESSGTGPGDGEG